MKMRIRLALFMVLTLVVACGADKAKDALGRKPAAVTDDGIVYPRTFSALLELRDSVSAQRIGGVTFSPGDPAFVFGCSEGSGGEFVFYMKAGDDQFKMRFGSVGFRDSLSSYPGVVDVELVGAILGASFDRAKQDFQLESCTASGISRVGASLLGTIECSHVTSLGSRDQSTLNLRFSCEIVSLALHSLRRRPVLALQVQ